MRSKELRQMGAVVVALGVTLGGLAWVGRGLEAEQRSRPRLSGERVEVASEEPARSGRARDWGEDSSSDRARESARLGSRQESTDREVRDREAARADQVHEHAQGVREGARPATPIRHVDRNEHAARPAPAAEEEEEASGVSSAEVAGVMRGHDAALTACYESSLKRSPRLRGRMVIAFDITTAGRVRGLEFTRDTLKKSELRACIAHRAQDWRFPELEGRAVHVVYPVVFAPQ